MFQRILFTYKKDDFIDFVELFDYLEECVVEFSCLYECRYNVSVCITVRVCVFVTMRERESECVCV